jgi:preprotein translocase subunit SecY
MSDFDEVIIYVAACVVLTIFLCYVWIEVNLK